MHCLGKLHWHNKAVVSMGTGGKTAAVAWLAKRVYC